MLEAQFELNNSRKIVENLEKKLKEREQEISNLNETVCDLNKNLEKFLFVLIFQIYYQNKEAKNDFIQRKREIRKTIGRI
jgi:uncharacterized protein YwgA